MTPIYPAPGTTPSYSAPHPPGTDHLTHRDLLRMERELGALHERNAGIGRELHNLQQELMRMRTEYVRAEERLSAQVTQQLGGVRSEMMTAMSEMKAAQVEMKAAQIAQTERLQRLMLLITALIAGLFGLDALLGLPG